MLSYNLIIREFIIICACFFYYFFSILFLGFLLFFLTLSFNKYLIDF
jgi:hypothetical protein